MFVDWDFASVCAKVRELGFTGIEVAPFTLASVITEVSATRRQQLRADAKAAGVEIIGLHWLLAKTTGFQLTSPEPEVQRRTGKYFVDLAHAAADLGGTILVLGSPLQRKIPAGYTRDQAEDFALATLQHCLPVLEQRGVFLCLEPLTPMETDFMLTASDAIRMIDRLQHPNVRLHLDVKAMSAEPEPTPEVIRASRAYTQHFHINDPTDPPRYAPGFGSTNFAPILEALQVTQYSGWVSLEVFQYEPDPVEIARRTMEVIHACPG
jgi:sugar phosphate isomerase/epimerase